MRMHRIVAALLWTLAAAAAFAVCAVWIADAQRGAVRRVGDTALLLERRRSGRGRPLPGAVAGTASPLFARHRPLAGSRASVELPSVAGDERSDAIDPLLRCRR